MFKHLVAVLFLGIALAGDAYAQSPHACVIESNFTGIFDAEQGNYTLIVIPGAAATLRANCTSSVNSYAWNPGNAQTASIPIVAPTVPGASAAYTLTGCDSVTRTCGTPVTITVQAAAATAPDCVLTASPNPATSGQSVTFTANCDAARPLPAKINYVDLSGTARSSSTLTFAATAPVVTVSTVRHVFYEAVSATNLAGPQRVLQVTVNPASAKARLQLIGLEVTQVVQDLRNSVPLVEAKPTVVRAHLRNLGTGNPTVDGQLLGNRIESNGSRTSLGTLSPSNAGRSIRVPQAPSRASIDDSFYFELPESWRTGRIELEFRGINTEMTCSEPDAAADCKVTVLFSPVSPLSIKFIGLTYNDAGGVAHTPTLGDVFQVATEFLAHYPINRIDGDLGIATIKANACLGFSVMAGVRKELNSLRNTDCKSDSCKQFYQGLLADQSSCSPAPGANGESDLPGAASVVFYPTDRIGTRAHEQGHALGFKHVDYTGDGKSGDEGCGDADRKAIACSKLEGDGTLSISKDQYAPNTAYGFDANNLSPQRIYAPETADFMSYGVRRWPSRSNYVQLFNKFKVAGGTDGIAVKGKSVTATLTVLIDGTVQFDGSAAEIGSVYVAMSPGTVTLPAAGTYAVRFENAQGATLATYSFEPVEGSESPTTGNFSLVLPWDATAKRIVLLRNGQPVASRQASASAPVVTVTSPNGGESLVGASTTFTWTASDPDGDALTYVVEYSNNNGATWKALTVGRDAKSLVVDLTRLPGGSQSLVRVTASDGFNSAADQSNAVFTVPLRAPTAFISTPENNRLYVGDQTILLKGMAFDVTDGLLDGARLTWRSSLDGALGTGSTLTINAMDLKEGLHSISLAGSNGTSGAGGAAISIRVLRDRPVLPSTLSIGPLALSFTAAAGSAVTAAQQIAIRNGGDGVLTWTASSDQTWLRFNSTTGTAPADLSITADPSGLAAGDYPANVTITSAGTTNSPQIVKVTLTVTSSQAAAQTVVEYVDTADFPESPGGHFFYSSEPAEQAAVDTGAAGKFERTGRQFRTGGTSPVCRFYGSMSPGPNSHFFTVDVAECNALKAAQKIPTPVAIQQWNSEGNSYNTTPAGVAANGARSCPAGTQPLYRAYNNAYPQTGPKNGWDSNHRFTPVLSDIAKMVTLGWRDEGIVFCTAAQLRNSGLQ